jgi:hypothetical protein
VDRRYECIRRRRQEAEDEMRPLVPEMAEELAFDEIGERHPLFML